MHLLPAPATSDEFDRQPVEQLRMAGTVAGRAEIARGSDQSLAEMVLPDAVDGDAGGQRVFRPGDPFSQLPAPVDRIEIRAI